MDNVILFLQKEDKNGPVRIDAIETKMPIEIGKFYSMNGITLEIKGKLNFSKNDNLYLGKLPEE